MTEPPSVTWHGHATVGVELDGQYFLTDPALTPRLAHLRRHHPVDLAQLGHPDVVLISHLHLDHLHPASLRLLADRLTDGATIVVPSGAAGEVEGLTGADVLETRVGDELRFGATTVRTVPAAHSDARGPHRRVRADAVGYVMSGPSGSVYFPGDTDLFDGMRELGDVDLALLPIAGWGRKLGPGHLDAQRAVEATRRVDPTRVVPIHWGTYSPQSWRRGQPEWSIRPPVEFAAALERDGLGDRLDILAPTAGRLGLPTSPEVAP